MGLYRFDLQVHELDARGVAAQPVRFAGVVIDTKKDPDCQPVFDLVSKAAILVYDREKGKG